MVKCTKYIKWRGYKLQSWRKHCFFFYYVLLGQLIRPEIEQSAEYLALSYAVSIKVHPQIPQYPSIQYAKLQKDVFSRETAVVH